MQYILSPINVLSPRRYAPVNFKIPNVFVNHAIKETLIFVVKEESRKGLFYLFKVIFYLL